MSHRFWGFGLAAGAALIAGAGPTLAQAPQVSQITPQLIEAAKKEGKVTFYVTEDLVYGAQVGKAFEAKYGIPVQVERATGEVTFQRVMQEDSSGIHNVDVVTTSNRGHFLIFRQKNLSTPYVTEDMLRFPAAQRDPDGYFATTTGTMCVSAYNTKLVKAEDAPKKWADLLDPKWKGKMAKAHPSFSGAILGCTFLLSKLLGWDFYKNLATQQVLQSQSAIDPPRKVAAGERAVMADGGENTVWSLMDAGEPISIVYPEEGTPGVAGAGGLMKQAPHPNAAKLFMHYLFSKDALQVFSNGGYRVFHPDVVLKDGRKPLTSFKSLFADPVELNAATEEVKAKYTSYFGT